MCCPESSPVDSIACTAQMASHQPTIHQQVAIGITSGLLVLTTFVVYIRLYIRCILLKAGSAGWDDLTVFIAWVSPSKTIYALSHGVQKVTHRKQIMALGASIATYYGTHVSNKADWPCV